MKRARHSLIVTILFLMGWGAAAYAGDTVTLKDDPSIHGPAVTLGEVADIQGDHAEALSAIELGPPLTPGASRRLDVALVVSRIKASGVEAESIELRGPRSITVSMQHHAISRDDIAESLRQFIESEMPWDPATTQIEVALPPQDLIVPEGNIEFAWKTDPQFRYLGTGGFRGALSVDGKDVRTITCRATIEAFAEVVVAAEDLPRGKILTLDDMVTQNRPLSALNQPGYKDPVELVGMMARTAISAGETITKRSVKLPSIIKRNQMVSVEMRAGGLQVQTQARAAMDAAAGDLITCVNMGSKQEFQGIVRKDGTVVVE